MAKAKTNSNALTPTLQKIEKFKKHHNRLFIASLLLIAFLLAWLIWHKQMTDMFSDLLGISTPTKSQTSSNGNKISSLDAVDDGTGNSTGSSGGGQTGGGSTSSTGTTTARGTTPTNKSTTNSSTTNNTYTSGNGGGSGGGGGGDNTTPTSQAKLINAYASITNGQSENQLLGLGIGQPDCLVTTVLLGEQKICTWTEGNATVIVTYVNGNVASKVKLGF